MGKRLWIFGGNPDTPAAWSADGIQWYQLPPAMENEITTSRFGMLVMVRILVGCQVLLVTCPVHREAIAGPGAV